MKKNNLNILLVTEDFYPKFIGGQGVYSQRLSQELLKAGHKVTVLAENRWGRNKFWRKYKNIQLFLTPFCFGNQLILALLEYLTFKIKLSRSRFDILHANQMSGLFFILFKPKNVGKIVVSAHNTNYDMAQKTASKIKRLFYRPLIFLERLVYKKADGILFNSPQEEIDLKNYFHLPKKVTKAIFLGTDIPKKPSSQASERIKIRRLLNLPDQAKLVLYIGRLVKRKKVDTLIEALGILAKNDPKIFGVIIGQGVERESLENKASPNTTFLGFVENTAPYLWASDVFVTVSVAEGGFLLSALEAAGYRLPLIVSPSAAGFPIVKDGINGFIIDPDNAKNLADKIKLAVDNDQVRRKMGQVSRKIAQNFSWEKTAFQTAKFYLSILQKPEDNKR